MNELHTMPVRVEKFLSSRHCRRMRLDEFGAFWRLLLEAWLEGARFPNDEEEIRAVLGRDVDDPETWQRIKRFVVDRMFGPSEDGQWLVNPTQSEVWAEVQTRRAVRAEAGRAGAEARWRANGKRIAEACDCHDFANGNQSQRQSQRQTESPPPPPPASGDGKPEGKQKPRRQRSPGPGFKGWSEDRFREDVREANTDGILSDIETEEFIAFWLEPDCRGRPKYQLQKTWSTRRRMQTALARIYEPRRRELTERLAGTGGSRLP